MEGFFPIIRAALALVGAAVALALVLGRRRHDTPTTRLGLMSPAASAERPEAGAAS